MNITTVGNKMQNLAIFPNETSIDTNTSKANFGNMLETIGNIEKRYSETQNMSYDNLINGQGSTHDMLINLQKATSEIKTLGVVRDKFVEGYQQIMSMQL